jgi:hypothetical protein
VAKRIIKKPSIERKIKGEVGTIFFKNNNWNGCRSTPTNNQ